MRLVGAAALGAICAPLVLRPASAEDFTGFYAGVNAGQAVDRDHGANGRPLANPRATPGATDDKALPPSAVNASRAMRDRQNASATGAIPLPR